MNYSKFHIWFACDLHYFHNINLQDVLDQPEKYLGLNYKELLNLWFYMDSWSDETRVVNMDHWMRLDSKTNIKAYKSARKLAKEVINRGFVAFLRSSELEIIAAHLYIERNIPFTFIPLIFDL
jgi:hypothetical protein